MRVRTGWLALLIVGAAGTAARAQSPYMYGPQPYPYAQPMPNYAAPRYPAPVYYPQPQPRVMYVPATPTNWEVAPAAAPALPAPVQRAASTRAASVPPADSASDVGYPEGDPGSLTVIEPTGIRAVLAHAAAHRRHAKSDGQGEACGPEGCPEDSHNWLPKGSWTVQMLGGAYADIGAARYNWAQSSLRLGRIWCCENFSHCPGAFEGLIDINGASTYGSDFGNYFTGMGLLCRYNLSTPGSRLVPYIQAGVGFQYNDAFEDLNQSYLGSRMALTVQGQIGLRIFLCKCVSLDLEGGYQAISDLGMSNRNDGLNAIGGMGGLTLYFPCGRR